MTGLALVLLTACGREYRLPESGATLEGKITYNGDELQFASIFVMGEGRLATGRINEDGRYTVENCPLGDVQVGVNTQASFGEFTSKSMAAGAYQGPEAKGRGKVKNLKFVNVPEKYFDPASSGLSTSVAVGTNTYDITLQK
jgi:hypothetical protein